MMKLEFDLNVAEDPELVLVLTEIRHLADCMCKANISRQEIWDGAEHKKYITQGNTPIIRGLQK